MSDKIYCGNGRIVITKFGEIPKISMSKKDINTIVDYMKKNKLEWINLEMLPKQNQEQGKPTHYLKVDTWKPDKSKQQNQPGYNEDFITNEEDLPF